jgi:hypothetical protein
VPSAASWIRPTARRESQFSSGTIHHETMPMTVTAAKMTQEKLKFCRMEAEESQEKLGGKGLQREKDVPTP